MAKKRKNIVVVPKTVSIKAIDITAASRDPRINLQIEVYNTKDVLLVTKALTEISQKLLND